MRAFKWVVLLAPMFAAPMAQATDAGALVRLESPHNVEATAQYLVTALQARGMTVFARIDHQAAASDAGLEMQPAQVIVYGNPKVGTPLMQADPELALQLPLKVLVTEVEGKTRVIFASTGRVLEGSRIKAGDVADTLGRNEGLIRALLAEQDP